MDRIIFLGVPINDYVANIIQAQLLFLESVDAKKDMIKHVKNLWDSDFVDINLPNDGSNAFESVTPRSTRIQEGKMYRTIQELKSLEKGL